MLIESLFIQVPGSNLVDQESCLGNGSG